MGNRRYRQWEAWELRVVNRAVLGGRTPKDIEHLLPGRTRVQIQNACNGARKRLRGERGSTDERRAALREDRASRVRYGMCCLCQNLLDDEGTLTKCSDCRDQRGEFFLQQTPVATKNQSDMLPWIYSRNPGNLASYLPKKSSLVVDLFAGSGRFVRAAARRGFDVVYNDVHPLLAAYTRACRDGRQAEINLATSEMVLDVRNFREHYEEVYGDPSDDLVAAATARVGAFNMTRGCHLDEVDRLRLAPLADVSAARAWRNVEVSCLDYADAAREHDRRGATFFVDCPYPGTDYYEHNLSWGAFGRMLDLLERLRGDVLMVLPTQRRTVKMVADRGFHLHLRQIKTPRYKGRDLVASSYPLKRDEMLTPFDAAQFGLGAEDELDEAVARVVEVVEEAGRPLTRTEIRGLTGDQDVWGAIARARAEGHLVRVGRERYVLPDAAAE